MLIQETFVDADKGHRYGESNPYEPFTDEVGRLFRSLQREYGRCVSRIYIDTNKGARPCGWVFQKRVAYDDNAEKFYTREVWVSLFERPDDVQITRHPFFLDRKGA